MFKYICIVAVLLLCTACSNSSRVINIVTDHEEEVWYVQDFERPTWQVWIQDSNTGSKTYVSVRSTPYEKIDVTRSCTDSANFETLSYNLHTKLLTGYTCRNTNRRTVNPELVDQLSELPNPPLEIRYELIQLLIALGEIADAE